MSSSTTAGRATDVEATALNDAQVAGYLARLGLTGPVAPTADWLERLHRAHVLAVPFENLDIHLDRPIRLDLDALFDKVVVDRRGGICYELNELFRGLLDSVGFRVTTVSGRVWLPDGSLSPPVDHSALLVDLDGTWLVDVGYGDAFTIPHRLGDEWSEPDRRLRTVPTTGGWRLEMDEGEGWAAVYDLDPTPRRLDEFVARCRWHETDPASFFRQVPVVTRATAAGRVAVVGGSFQVRSDGARTEQPVTEEGEITSEVQDHFTSTLVEKLAGVLASPQRDERGGSS
jgi:N-hydroxyarylamine O-acetyltransferase